MVNFKTARLVIGLIGGLIILVIGLTTAVTNGKFEKSGREVSAVIVDYDEFTGERVSYTLHVEYTVDGKNYREKIKAYPHSFSVGEEITVLYLPSNPQKIRELSGTNNDSVKILGLFGGGIALVCGIFLYLNFRKRNSY